MRTPCLATLAALAAALAAPTHAANDIPLQRLATCQDSWLEWKNDAPRMAQLVSDFTTRFVPEAQGAAFTPKAATQVMGLKVVQVFPESVGMGVGFSLTVNAGFAQARQALEKQLGVPMRCSKGDGMEACEASLGEKKTAMLMTGDDGRGKTSLLGCYYYYEK